MKTSLTIRKRSHHFLIQNPDKRVRLIIRDFTRPLINWNFRRVRGRTERTIVNVYSVANSERTEYRFFINLLDKFLDVLKLNGIRDDEITIIEDKPSRGEKVTFHFKPEYQPREEQAEALEYLQKDGDPVSKLLTLSTGVGKAQPLDALVLAPEGYRTMGSLSIGSIITAWDGSRVRVTGIHPQGIQDVYEFVFSGNRRAQACINHIWEVFINHERNLLSTNDLLFILHHDKSDIYIREFRPLGEDQFVKLESIHYVGKKDVQCIAIDHPDKLYVTNDSIVIHNTFTSLYTVKETGRRAAYFMPAKYLSNWEEAVEKFYVEGEESSRFVSGSDQLRKLIKEAKEGKKLESNILFSSNTFGAWLKMYEKERKVFNRTYYGVTPDKLWKLLGIDTVVIDEAHEFLHFNHKLFMYLNVHKSISLTATYESKDKLTTEIHELMHPKRTRYVPPPPKKYTESVNWLYEVVDPEKVRITYDGNAYSHHAFETSLLRHPKRRARFYEMIEESLRVDFFDIKDPGQSAIVYLASVDNCKDLASRLQKKHPELLVTFFVAGSDYTKEFLDADIVVSTLGKSGTAVDKPGLRTVILTIGIDSHAAFKQVLGRLREIEGKATRFSMFVASNIEKQYRYYKDKGSILKERTLSIINRVYRTRI